jgi:hypothetical protein
MSRQLLEKLANKFAHEHFEAKNNINKEKFESFYYDNVGQLKQIIGEMSGDLLILKEKNFPLDLRQLFGKIYQQILGLYKDIDPEDPYPGTLNFINWANAKHNKSLLENLDFLIEKHLEKSEVAFYGKDILKQPKVSSIKKLMKLIPELKQFIIDNPAVPSIADAYQKELSTLEQPNEFTVSGPEDSTKPF